MKKIYFLLLALGLFTGVEAQIINFSSSDFKAKLLAASPSNGTAKNLAGVYFKIDSNSDNEIQVSEAVQVSALDLQNNYIGSLDGISNFSNLTTLNCKSCGLGSLNLNGLTNFTTLDCTFNYFQTLDLSGLPSLISLNCTGDYLTSLNLNGLTNLKFLTCKENQLATLNLTGLTSLESLSCGNNFLTSLNLTGLTNLKSLICENNQLTSLNPSGLTNLTSIQCSNNQLASLNVNGLVNLIFLICNDNLLASLNVSGLTNLGALKCYNNQLPSLDVNGLINLETLDCNNNLLTSLHIADLQDLQNLDCSNNQLTSLTLNNLGYLGTVRCDYNQLTTIDVSSVPGLHSLYCSNNQLNSLFVKNGSYEDYVDFSNNPNMQYVCADEVQIQQISANFYSYGLYYRSVNSYCTFVPGGTYYTVYGNSKHDGNNNGCDLGDIQVPNMRFNITNGSQTNSVLSNTTGYYSLPVLSGTSIITPVFENPGYFSISPSNFSVSFPTQSNPFNRDFCVTINGVHPDLEITLLPLGPARPGFASRYKIIFKNKGNQLQSGSINLNFNDAIENFMTSNPAAANLVVNTATWDFLNLKPFETREIEFTLSLNSPIQTPAVNNGDILHFTVSISSVATDDLPNDNTFAFNQTVVNSFDPNDKTCLEGTTIAPSEVGKYVHYMIRFENTGTFPAENIVVKDIIDTAKFDLASLVPMKGSHPFVTNITSGNKVEFIFENINLPFDDANNDGYLAFKIKTKPTLVNGDTFSNTASIYFDYNFPIVTNTATTTIQQVLNVQDFEFSNYFSLYPNPVSEVLNISAKESVQISSINIYNTLGQLVLVIPSAKDIKMIDVSSLTSGNFLSRYILIKEHRIRSLLRIKL